MMLASRRDRQSVSVRGRRRVQTGPAVPKRNEFGVLGVLSSAIDIAHTVGPDC